MRTKFLVCVLAVLGLTNCSKEEHIETESQSPERIEFGFSLGGEISVDTEPLSSLTRSVEANDLIGVQVYAVQENASLQAYAYGLFDNVGKLRISLIKGNKYLFKTTLLKEAKTKLRRYPNDWANGSNKPVFFFEPFQLPGSTDSEIGCELTNAFTYSNSIVMEGLNKGLSDVGSGSVHKVKRPNLVRYYGETEFVATEGTKISIDLLKTVFGVRYSVKNLINGSVRFQVEGAIAANTGAQSVDLIYTFEQLSTRTDYSESVNVTAIWINDRQEEIPVASQQVSFSRSMRTTLTIDMDKVGKVDSDVEVSIDKGEMQDGGNVELG